PWPDRYRSRADLRAPATAGKPAKHEQAQSQLCENRRLRDDRISQSAVRDLKSSGRSDNLECGCVSARQISASEVHQRVGLPRFSSEEVERDGSSSFGKSTAQAEQVRLVVI